MHKQKHRHKHKNLSVNWCNISIYKHLIATAQVYLHFAHAYLHSVIQDGVPRHRGRIARNWDFASYFMTTKQKSKESTNTKKEKCMCSQRSSYERTLLDQYL